MSRTLTPGQRRGNMDRIYRDWDKALSENDAKALLQLYAPNAVIESPLIPHLIGKPEGICRGHEEMKPFLKRSPGVSLRFASFTEPAISPMDTKE